MSASISRLARAMIIGAALFTAACDTTDRNGGTVTEPSYTPVATTVQLTDVGVVRDGDVRALSAIVKDQKGREMPGVPVAFVSTDPSVAAIGLGNMLTALREGVTDIVAIAGNVQQRTPLTVQLHPATAIEVSTTGLSMMVNELRTVQTTVRGLDNRVLHNRTLSWQSSNTNVVRVDAQGRITAVAPGSARVTVQYGSLARIITVEVGGYATLMNITHLDGRALPANVYEEIITRDDGTRFTAIEQLEAGMITFSDRYAVTLTIAVIERYTFQGNVIERVVRRRQVRDEGSLEYNWLDSRARLLSSMVGGLSHEIIPDGNAFRLNFRIGGTNTIWGLGLRAAQ